VSDRDPTSRAATVVHRNAVKRVHLRGAAPAHHATVIDRPSGPTASEGGRTRSSRPPRGRSGAAPGTRWRTPGSSSIASRRKQPSSATRKRRRLVALSCAMSSEAAERLAASPLAQARLARWEETVRAAGAQPFTLTLETRLVSGLGAHGPLEIGFRFDRLGFPVLPGSGLKGVARAYAHLVERRDESDPDFLAVFGRVPRSGDAHEVGQAGALVFFDAYPEPGWRLELDVMTPHYPDYYSGKEPPTPWQNPTPITFLAVAPGTRYRLAIGLRQGASDPDGRLRQLALGWLRNGLAQLGFGAKTTSGYGVFRNRE
jgi:CRISPR type III-B/RAMP module RAMP protein Cmr6